jgi:hypothetical protein
MGQFYVGNNQANLYDGSKPATPVQHVYHYNELIFDPDNISPSGQKTTQRIIFDSNSNDVIHNVTGVLSGATIDTSLKKFGASSLSLANSTDKSTTPITIPLGASNYTVECWIYQTSENKGKVLCSSSDFNSTTKQGEFQFLCNADGKLEYKQSYHNVPTDSIIKYSTGSSSALPTDQWVHVAAVRQTKGNFADSVTTLFIDGVKQFQTSQPSSASQGVQDFAATELVVGTDGINDSFIGNVDNFLIFDNAQYKDGATFTPSNTTPAP